MSALLAIDFQSNYYIEGQDQELMKNKSTCQKKKKRILNVRKNVHVEGKANDDEDNRKWRKGYKSGRKEI